MSRYSGPADRHDGRPSQVAKQRKRAEAIARNALTPVERRRWYRLGLDGPEGTKPKTRQRKTTKLPAQPP